MNTASDWNELSAFVDGELEVARARNIAERVLQDSVLRRQIEDMRRLSASLKALTYYYHAPETLRLAIRMAGADCPPPAGTASPPCGSGSSGGPWHRRWRLPEF